MKKVFLIFFALVVIFGISVIPCFAAGELVGQSNVVTVQLARPKLYYDPSYTSGARLSWDAVGSNGAVTLYYQSHQMYLRDEAAVAYTNANFTTNSSYGFFELNSFAFDTYKTDGSSWIKFYITETVDGVTVQSNDIYVDVCTKQHIVDTNSDGYDDSSYTAGYNGGIQSAPKKVGITLSVEKRTIDKADYIGTVYSFPTVCKVTGWTRTLSFNCEVIQTDTSTQVYDNTNGEATGVTIYYPAALFTTSGAYTFTVTPTSDSPYLNGNTSTVVYNISVLNGVVTVGSCVQSITVDGTCDKLHMTDTDNDGYDDVSYQNGIAEGFTRGSNNSGVGDLTDLFPKILGSVAGFFISTTGNMTVAGLSVLSIFSVMALGVGIFYLIKVLK